jgi:hypothetical protein
VDQQSPQTVIDRSQHAFRLAILLGRIGAGETQGDAMRGEESTESSRVVLTAIVSLHGDQGKTKLSLYVCVKGTDDG